MKIHFVSLNSEFINCISKLKWTGDIKWSCCDINNINKDKTAFMSPANSFLFMDGGIDYQYSRVMFPNVEKELKKKLNILNIKTLLGRNYLPIGSSITVEVDINTILIASPTMFLPHNVSSTNNAYYSFMSTLLAFDKYKKYNKIDVDTLIVTSLCCGYGKMKPDISAIQIYNAYNDYLNGKIPKEITDIGPDYLILPHIDHDQPINFDNREIRTDLM